MTWKGGGGGGVWPPPPHPRYITGVDEGPFHRVAALG